MEALPVYIACIIGAVGVWMVLTGPSRGVRLLGAVVGLGALAWVLGQLLVLAGDAFQARPSVFSYVFGFIAVGTAVRMISHERPVYSALYFVLVVISSAAIFLLLEAEFMAFALIIVYAGAILITYLFVLMLAQQSPSMVEETGGAAYDRIPREPAAGVAVGFLVLALLGHVIVVQTNPAAEDRLQTLATGPTRLAEHVENLNLMKNKRFALFAHMEAAGVEVPEGARVEEVTPTAIVLHTPVEGGADDRLIVPLEEVDLTLEEVAALAQNIERVGMALVYRFPVSLELAGVILLMAMFGAVVLARKQIQLGEDEKRAAAGLSRLTVEPEEAPAPGSGPGNGSPRSESEGEGPAAGEGGTP